MPTADFLSFLREHYADNDRPPDWDELLLQVSSYLRSRPPPEAWERVQHFMRGLLSDRAGLQPIDTHLLISRSNERLADNSH